MCTVEPHNNASKSREKILIIVNFFASVASHSFFLLLLFILAITDFLAIRDNYACPSQICYCGFLLYYLSEFENNTTQILLRSSNHNLFPHPIKILRPFAVYNVLSRPHSFVCKGKNRKKKKMNLFAYQLTDQPNNQPTE